MSDIKFEKICTLAVLMGKYNYKINEIIDRRINNYDFQPDTVITHNDQCIKISTEIGIKGVYNVLLLFPDGQSKLLFEFE